MLDFNNILATPGADIQYFEGPVTTTLSQYQVWKKPRGAKFVYMIGVGGGGGGSCGNAAAVSTGGGGAGGSSGGQTSVMIPAMFVPDTLYIQAGAGGAGATTSAGFGAVGLPTYVCISPYTSVAPAGTFLLANGGTVSAGAPTSANGGTAPGAVQAATLTLMCLAGRGFSTRLAGQVGGAGAAANASTAPTVNLPTTGLMVTGGSGGGGVGSGNGGSIFYSGSLGADFLPILQGGVNGGGGSATPGKAGFIARNFLMNYGGTGGAAGGSGLQGSAGGNGAPGCGGGGGGGASTSFPTIAPAGAGGPGFVYIITT